MRGGSGKAASVSPSSVAQHAVDGRPDLRKTVMPRGRERPPFPGETLRRRRKGDPAGHALRRRRQKRPRYSRPERAFFSLVMLRCGGSPNSLLYSLLNCVGLS